MAKTKSRKKWTPTEGPGTYISRDLFESEAFLALKGFAPQLLVLILGKRWFINVGGKRTCTNPDNLTFAYIEAERKYGINQPRFTRAIDELLSKGFIKIVHQGGAYKQDKSVYGLSEDWRFWVKGQVVKKRERDSCQKGFRHPKKARNIDTACAC